MAYRRVKVTETGDARVIKIALSGMIIGTMTYLDYLEGKIRFEELLGKLAVIGTSLAIAAV